MDRALVHEVETPRKANLPRRRAGDALPGGVAWSIRARSLNVNTQRREGEQ
jgi:hypothetical protein